MRKNFLNINLSETITNERERERNNYIKVNLCIKVNLKHKLGKYIPHISQKKGLMSTKCIHLSTQMNKKHLSSQKKNVHSS